MENAKNRDPLSRPCKSTQTTKHPIESRGGVPLSESSTSSAKFSNRFYFPASSKRVSTGLGGLGASGYRKTSLYPGQNDNYSSSMLRDEDDRTAAKPLRRVQPNNACSGVSRRDRPTCICFLQRRAEKATETAISHPAINKTTQEFARTNISQEASSSNPVSKKNCGRCYTQRGTATNEPKLESMIQFYKTYEKTESQDFTAPIAPELNFTAKKLPNTVLSKDSSPKKVMNTWVPSREKPVESLFPPSENYIDVSTRDFSLRKYFPELFLSKAEKNEIREKEQEELQEEDTAPQKDSCRGKECPQGKCNSEEKESFKDWRTIIELGSPNRTPCPWSEEGTILTPDVPDNDREEEIGEESNIQLAPEQRPRGWRRWSYGKFNRGINKEKKKSNGKQN